MTKTKSIVFTLAAKEPDYAGFSVSTKGQGS